MGTIIAIVGMPGSGKTEVSRHLIEKGFSFIRLGQLTMDEVKKRGLEPIESNERPIREELRKVHGMAAFAVLNFPKIDELAKKGNVVVDGLYSWQEFIAFKEKYQNNFHIIAVYASPKTRYHRLESQVFDKENDKTMSRRHYSKDEAKSRDKAQLENLHTGGPIAMADFTIVNETDPKNLKNRLDEILSVI